MQRSTHDPYRSGTLDVPQLEDPVDLIEPVDGPVRILAVVDRYPPWVNAGAEWMLHSIFRRLKDFGHDVMVATNLPTELRIPASSDGIPVYPMGMADQLATVADVMVGHLLWTREVVTIAKDHSLPLMYLLHNDRQISHWDLATYNVTVLVPNSEWVARRSVDDGWSGPMFVCRPPVFCDDYTVDEKDAHREFVTLVNPIPEKGAILFYQLAQRLHRRKFLAVTGAYGHQHRPPPMVDNVTMIPPTADMRGDVYAKTKVLLMPSSYESWGRVAVEAMAAGIPVIAHPTDGLIEALGDAAIFEDRENVNAWQKHLSDLDDPKVWRKRSAAGRLRAQELEAVTDRDLTMFDLWVRRCATLTPVSVPGSTAVRLLETEETSGPVLPADRPVRVS